MTPAPCPECARRDQRLASIAALFGVPDGGRYFEDWKSRAAGECPECERLREYAAKLYSGNRSWERSLVKANRKCMSYRRSLRLAKEQRRKLLDEYGTLQEKIAQGLHAEVMVERIHAENGRMDIRLRTDLALIFASVMADFLKDGPGNYNEIGVSHPELGMLTMTIQRVNGKTPGQVNAELRAGNAATLAVLRAVEWAGTGFKGHSSVHGDILVDVCPACRAERAKGHAPDCTLNATIKRLEAEGGK